MTYLTFPPYMTSLNPSILGKIRLPARGNTRDNPLIAHFLYSFPQTVIFGTILISKG
jgi:hypothetical protein